MTVELLVNVILPGIAGTLGCVSAAPRVLHLLREPSLAAKESLSRNALLASSNVLWVVFALATNSFVQAAMCAIASLLNGTVLALVVLDRRHAKANTHKAAKSISKETTPQTTL